MNKEVVWEKTGLAHPQDAERLPNGNTLIAETDLIVPNRIIEINPDGDIVWILDEDFKYPVDVERLPPPSIEITNPKEGYFHFRDKPLFSLNNKTIVYGPTNIKVNVTPGTVVEKIEFYINDKLEKNLTREDDPYEYKWTPTRCGRYTIKTVVYDIAGQSATDSIVLFKWRAHPFLILAGLGIIVVLLTQMM